MRNVKSICKRRAILKGRESTHALFKKFQEFTWQRPFFRQEVMDKKFTRC